MVLSVRNDDSAFVLEHRQGDCLANMNDTFMRGLPTSEIRRRHPRIRNGYAEYENSPDSFPWSAEFLKSCCISMLGALKQERWVPYHRLSRSVRRKRIHQPLPGYSR